MYVWTSSTFLFKFIIDSLNIIFAQKNPNKSINREHLKFPYLVMKVQSCSTLFSSWTPISGSEVTSWPLWRQCKVVILSTRAAVQWKGSRSPLKTTWRWDGSSDRVCSSRGPSEQHGGKKCRSDHHTSFSLITQPQQNVSTGAIASLQFLDAGNSNSLMQPIGLAVNTAHWYFQKCVPAELLG